MDFLTPIINQARDLFASMTPGARLTAGLLVAVVLVSMGFLFQQVSSGPDDYLFGGASVEPARLPGVEAALGGANIDYELEGLRVRVAQNDRNRAIAAVADANQLPPEFFTVMNKALDGGGMFDFKDIKMQRVRTAREQQASMILTALPWVQSVRVMHNVGEKNGLARGTLATASVSVTPAAGQTMTNRRMRTIKSFVAGACMVPSENVEVISLGDDAIAGDGAIEPTDYEHPYYRIKAMEEARITAMIREQLSYIDGIRVKVRAMLDSTSEQKVVATEPNGDPVALSQDKSETTEEQTIGRFGDRVGVTANDATGPASAGRDDSLARTDKVSKSQTADEKQSAIGVTTTETVSAGFVLKEADASVAVPLSYVEAVYREENADENGDPPETIDKQVFDALQSSIKDKVENLVQPLLPKLSLGENEYRQVNVTFIRDLPGAPIPEPSLAIGALGWLSQNANTLAMAGLAVFSLVMLRSMVSSSGKPGDVSGLPSLQLDGETLAEADGEDDEEPQRPKLKLRKADTLKDDLTEMVSSDPDAAAAILRSWINNAA